MNDLCKLALRLLRRNGGHPIYGAHYREFVALAGRCMERVAKFANSGRLAPRLPLTTFLSAAEVKEILLRLADRYGAARVGPSTPWGRAVMMAASLPSRPSASMVSLA